jgi:hypothetical protein
MCADLTNDESPIPDGWRRTIARILRQKKSGTINWTKQATADREALFPDAWEYEFLDAIASALEIDGILGRLIETMRPPGVVYQFFFIFRKTKLFAKINLLPNGKVIIIYSCHLRQRDTL